MQNDNKILLEYFNDLYPLFLKDFSKFSVNPLGATSRDCDKLTARLAELIKIKNKLTITIE